METRKNVAIMVMAANMEPSTRNLEAIKETMIRYQNENCENMKHYYDWYFYWCDETIEEEVVLEQSEEYENLGIIKIKDEESVYRTFEKSIKVFDLLSRTKKYDWYVRINISMFLNMKLLDSAINVLKSGKMYGNAMNSYVNLNSKYCNDLYVRGDLMIFDSVVMEGILSQALRFMYSDMNMKSRDGVDHVDDCLIGCCFIEYSGSDYYKNLYMLNYQYIPDNEINENSKVEMNNYCIGARVKTVPPTVTYSGYSWDDNEYRKVDCVKMRKLDESVRRKNIDYKALQLRDLLVDKKDSRKTLFISASSQNVYDIFYRYLEQKYKVSEELKKA